MSSLKPVVVPTMRPSSLSVRGDVGIHKNVTPLHLPLAPPPPPSHSFAIGGTIPHPLTYPTYNVSQILSITFCFCVLSIKFSFASCYEP